MTYDRKFYLTRDATTRYAADTVVAHVLRLRPSIASALDVGCGVGTWLKALEAAGVPDIYGIEGPWLDISQLVIPAARFTQCDFTRAPLPATRRVDLTMCLEVAEHIPPSQAADFIAALASTSDLVLFSAAIPGQGGIGHLNEQWPAYWETLFAAQGMRGYDVIRSQIWLDRRIPFWYRQNIMLFGRGDLPVSERGDWNLMPLAHPECFSMHANLYVRGSLLKLRQSVTRAVRRRLGATG